MEKEEKYQELIRLQKESNLSVKEFCYNHGIAYSTFYYWFKKITRSEKLERPVGFIPLLVKEVQRALPSLDKSSPNRATGLNEDTGANFELVYPNGVVLRIKRELDLASLQSLIQLQE